MAAPNDMTIIKSGDGPCRGLQFHVGKPTHDDA